MRKILIATSLVTLTTLTLAGWAYARGWWPFANQVVVNTKSQPNFGGHEAPRRLLAHALHRLHDEALIHFHADPQNGFSRMPIVYEKVLKEWATPYFSPGELDNDEPIPFKEDMERIHTASLHDFMAKQPLAKRPDGIPVVMAVPTDFDKNKKVWEAKTVDLVGLLKHVHPVVYISEHLPDSHDLCEVKTRHLDDFELAALSALQKGDEHFARSRDGVIRLMGAIRARNDCLDCHSDKNKGDLLGALSYTVRPAEYAKVPWKLNRAAQNQTQIVVP